MNPFPRLDSRAGHRPGALADLERAARRARERELAERSRGEETTKDAGSFTMTLALAMTETQRSGPASQAKGGVTDQADGAPGSSGGAPGTPAIETAGTQPDPASPVPEEAQEAATASQAEATPVDGAGAAKAEKGPAAKAAAREGTASNDATGASAVKLVSSSTSSGNEATTAQPGLHSRKDPEGGAAAENRGNSEASRAHASSAGVLLPSPEIGSSLGGRASRADATSGSRVPGEETAARDPRLASQPEASTSARGASRVVLDFTGENGIDGRLRVALRGDAVRATIVSRDADTARRLDGELGELQRALAARGFSGSHVTVHHAAEGTASESSRQSKGEDPRSQDRGRGSEGSYQEDGGQDSWGGRSRTSQREREKR